MATQSPFLVILKYQKYFAKGILKSQRRLIPKICGARHFQTTPFHSSNSKPESKIDRISAPKIDPKLPEQTFQILQESENVSDSTKTENLSKDDKKTVVATVKEYIRMRRDFSKKYTDNNTVTAVRAMQEYVLKPSDLQDLKLIKIRSPYRDGAGHLLVYLERDIIKKAMEVHGNKENLELEQKRIKRLKQKQKNYLDWTFVNKEEINVDAKKLFKTGPGRVVAVAAAANGVICLTKFSCWLWTGSASMFSETLHSFADMGNQLLLLWGVYKSMKIPDEAHPYGFGNMRYIVSLISGVGIFCIGCGASIYHGITTMSAGHSLDSVTSFGAFGVLAGSALVESASLIVAIDETKHNAAKQGMSFWNYVRSSQDPSTNVVLLEDSCAVLGVGIAGVALACAQYMQNPIYDCVGSIAIGGLLGLVATFLVRSNVEALIGQSIPQNRLDELQEQLEDDAVIRGLYDIKATQLGYSEFKFKAEIDFDGREVTRAYLESQDFQKIMNECNNIDSEKELEIFLLNHGEKIIDTLGMQVDRLEGDLKRNNPGLRHIDLEVL
ncbi:proton-coupled zinc antiporter SLC30A9, mitochondrial-like [Styela clava]